MNELPSLNQTEPAQTSHTEYILSIVYVLEVRTALPLGGLAEDGRRGEAGNTRVSCSVPAGSDQPGQ